MDFKNKVVQLYHQGWTPKELAQRLYLRFEYLNEILRQADISLDNSFQDKRNKQVTLMPFIGPSGSGKTVTLAKYASYLHKKKDLLLLSADNYSLGGWEKLVEFSQILELRADRYDRLFNYIGENSAECIYSLEAFDTILIQTPGNIIQAEFKEVLEKISSFFESNVSIIYIFVIDIAYLLSDHYSELISSYSCFEPQEVVLTRADYLENSGGNSLFENKSEIWDKVKDKLKSLLPSIHKSQISVGKENLQILIKVYP